jgi:hypothetical protein
MIGPRLILLLVAAGLAVTGCRGSGGTADGASADPTARAGASTTTRPTDAAGSVFADARFGFTFRYPRGWSTGDFTYEADQTTGARPAASTAVGIDRNNSVLLTRYELATAVTAQEVPDQLGELNGVISRFAGRPYVGEVADVEGVPAVRYQAFALQADAARRSSRVVFLFDGTAEYELNCQSTPDRRAEMDRGCDQILATLRRK